MKTIGVARKAMIQFKQDISDAVTCIKEALKEDKCWVSVSVYHRSFTDLHSGNEI